MAKTDQEMGEALYGKPAGQTEPAPEKGESERKPLQGLAFDEMAGKALYPEHNDRFPRTEEGHVLDCIRDTSGGDRGRGRILVQGNWDGRIDKLLQSNATRLDNADLAGETISVEVRDGSMRMSDFCDTVLTPDGSIQHSDLRGSDWRGAEIHGSLAHSDLRGADFNGDTDIAGADFLNCKLDGETFEKLRGCKGFTAAKHLVKPVE
jgi:hypothetical protein